MITFTIPGEPVPLLRPRVVQNKYTHHIHAYTPDKCAVYAERVRLYALRHLENTAFQRLTGPLEVFMTFYRTKPKSAGKKDCWPVTRPDLSNYVKLVEDALNGLLWVDDSQIVISTLRKMYVSGEDEARTEVSITEVLP